MSNPEKPAEETLINSRIVRDIASFAVIGAIVGGYEGVVVAAVAGSAAVGYKKFNQVRERRNNDYPPHRGMDI